MKKIIFLIIIAGAGFFFINPDINEPGNPLNALYRTISSKISSLSTSTSNQLSSPGENITVYKYQDKNGQWHFSNQSEGDHKNQTAQEYNINTNIVPSVKPKPDMAKEPTDKNSQENAEDDLNLSPFSVYTEPGKIKKLIEDAKSIQENLNNRKSDLDKQIDGL